MDAQNARNHGEHGEHGDYIHIICVFLITGGTEALKQRIPWIHGLAYAG